VPPLNLYARVRILLHHLHARPRVQRVPGFPCAPHFRGTRFRPTLGRVAPRGHRFMFGDNFRRPGLRAGTHTAWSLDRRDVPVPSV